MPYKSAKEISQASVPVILPDTCILLDIIRSPRRDDVNVRNATTADRIVKSISSGTVASIVAEQVKMEFNNNLSSVLDQTRNDLNDLRNEFEKVNDWSGLSEIKDADYHSTWIQAVDNSTGIAHSWVTESLEEKTTKVLRILAQGRMSSNITPARQGKGSFSDCLIVETYMDFARRIRFNGFSNPIIFASSNTNDFAEVSQTKLRPDIAEEFENEDIQYARNLLEISEKLGF